MERQIDRPSANLIMLIGVIQGFLLLWLWKSAEWHSWPATSHMALGALLWPALVVPAIWYLSENTGANRRFRAALALLGGVSFALLGAYGGWLEEPLQSADRSVRLINSLGSFAHALASAVLGFVSLVLILNRRGGGWDYPGLFDMAWRNVMLCASAASITGLFWVCLAAGAMLMDLLGLGFIKELIKKPVFIFPVTGLVVSAAFIQAHKRVAMLETTRQYALALMAWLLPLMLGFGVMWVVALPSAGVGKLFSTGNAAFILLWFVTLSVSFMNSAWQDGRQTPVYPAWLRTTIRYAWLSLLPVIGIALWALWLRIDQYGLTEHRIWALFVCCLALLYVFGYAISVFYRPSVHWMKTIGSTNIVVALVMCVGLMLLVTPLADPRRLATQDQVDRLLSGSAAPSSFDYDYMRWQSARWGIRKLESLASLEANDREKEIATRAQQMLERTQRYPLNKLVDNALELNDARRRIEVLHAPGESKIPPDSLYEWLVSRGSSGIAYDCLRPDRQCLAWMVDLNEDGADEVLLLVGMANWISSAYVLVEDNGRWSEQARLESQLRPADWRREISAGQFELLPRSWPDLKVGKQLVSTQRLIE